MKRFVVACSVASMSTAMFLIGSAGSATAAPAASKPAMRAVTSAPRVPAGARSLGAVKPTATVRGTLVLQPRNAAALTNFIAGVTTPKSAEFHHYLAAGAFASRFGPASATIAAVRSQLHADGLTVTGIASDGLLVRFSGTAQRVEKAFGTGLQAYRLANGSAGQATTSAIKVPASIAAHVTAVIGLDNLVRAQAVPVVRSAKNAAHPAAKTAAGASAAFPPGAPDACSGAQAAAQEYGGLTDDQIARAYGAFGLYGTGDFGAGQSIAVYELEPFLKSDIETFDTCYFGASAAAQMATRLHQVNVDGGEPAGTGSGESVLDIQDVSAMAPGARIDVYEAPNSFIDGVDEYAAIINTDKDQVITTSWGLCEQGMQLGAPGVQQTENELFEQAAAQGQSVFAAAGDTGDDSCNEFRAAEPPTGQNPLSVLDPGSQPYVISVGGTTINNAATQPPQEQVWNDGAEWGAGGGGISQSWVSPSWQRDARVPGIALPGSTAYKDADQVETQAGYRPNFCQNFVAGATASTPCRLVPDVSAQADEFTGAVTIYASVFGGWTTIGGTSSATPIWAALLADVNASPTCQANPVTKSGVGFASPLLYGVASNPTTYAASFNDIAKGNNDIYGLDNGMVFPATKGYDMASGLGSPQLTGSGGTAGLAADMCSLAASTSGPAVTGLNPEALSVKGGKVTITGHGFTSGGKPDVSAIQVGTTTLKPAKFTVKSGTVIVATLPDARDTRPTSSPVPQDGAGPAEIVVTSDQGQSSRLSAVATLQYVDHSSSGSVPAVTGMGPNGGSETKPGPVRIYGAGFTGATGVTFGGVKAAKFKVVTPDEIVATPGRYSSKVSCAPSVKGETPTTDICQVQVRVTNAHGTSATGKILRPLEGLLPAPSPMAVITAPRHCHCEVAPGATEFDYLPKPTITSVSTSLANPSSLASEYGGTELTIKGRGLDELGLLATDFGDPGQQSSEDFNTLYVTGTEVQVFAPGTAELTTEPTSLPVRMYTVAGVSGKKLVIFAGTPDVSSVLTAVGKLPGSADTGGTRVTIKGAGFDQAFGPIVYSDLVSPFSAGTQYRYTINGDGRISTRTVQQNPALVEVWVCSVTGCSSNYADPGDVYILYPPGKPVVRRLRADSGPAAGGNEVHIFGSNLGCVTGVFFGTTPAATFTNAQALLDCGSTHEVTVTAPAGTAGTTVPVTVTTVESELTGAGPSRTTASYTYSP
ncbi:MAG TPA: protease pro-enzyme activation domain-containing protein [Streptosporangiaceae bacterium]|nr:protease pro-enzyme activation domain-containing protein [Streptosporangiaceae bacterium]